ncbi:MAG: GTPase Era [Alphaproteobacteria bacterium MarineAlpha2_Bin1]|nr:MAG: GTPase Era [Alphaproteobacteria bacterium MarineAlpha2_Bin1]|tara:strand:- start:196 stop:1098 length:903 start_codon:yes stop_codon:yes gene_type:complete
MQKEKKIKNLINSKTYAGFITLIGAPNSGKSTFINRIIGQKVAIVSPKVQTTRTRILGIVNYNQSQLIFVDIPGIIKPKGNLNVSMMDIAWSSIKESDIHIFLIDGSRMPEKLFIENKLIIDSMGSKIKNTILVINKIDKLKKNKLLKVIESFENKDEYMSIFFISSLNGDGVADLIKFISLKLPKSNWLYPEDQISDIPIWELASEITREKLFLYLSEELPYSLSVKTTDWKETKKNYVVISQTIFVKKQSQKIIIIGKEGKKIKEIGTSARIDIEKSINMKVFLKLFVKVDKNWDLNI